MNDTNLLIFDSSEHDYKPDQTLGLVEVGSYEGWEPRSVFVANTGLTPSTFVVGFQSAVHLASTSLLMFILIII